MASGVGSTFFMSATRDDDATEGPRSSSPAAIRADGAEACYWRGRAAARSAQRRRHFQEGMSLAGARLARSPDDPEGLFWRAVNLGAEALERGRLQALPVLPEMERLLLRCHSCDPRYQHAGPARVLGRLYDKAPAVISIGSGAKARQWLESALALDGEFPGNLAFAADFFGRAGDSERARQLAEFCQARMQALESAAEDLGPDAAEWRAIVAAIFAAGVARSSRARSKDVPPRGIS